MDRGPHVILPHCSLQFVLKCLVAAVKRVRIIHHSADYIFVSF